MQFGLRFNHNLCLSVVSDYEGFRSQAHSFINKIFMTFLFKMNSYLLFLISFLNLIPTLNIEFDLLKLNNMLINI